MSSDFWEINAGSWSQAILSGNIESRKITGPAIVGAILGKSPRRVLDLGCGEGWLCNDLAAKSVDYTGLDGSSALIRTARASRPGNFFLVTYDELSRGEWKPITDFDVVVFNFSLMDEELEPLLKMASSFLNENGTLLIQTLHPKHALVPYEDGWREEDFKNFPVLFKGTMRWYGRTLESWNRLFGQCGLVLEQALEPAGPGSSAPASIIFSLRSGSSTAR